MRKTSLSSQRKTSYTHRGTIQNTPDFSSETMAVRTVKASSYWNIINMPKEKKLSAKILCQEKISFRISLRHFQVKENREFVASRPSLQNILKGVLQAKGK